MTIQVRYSHIRCSHVLKNKIMTEEGSQQEPAGSGGPTKLRSFLGRSGHRGALSADPAARNCFLFHVYILQTWTLQIYRSLLALGDGDCSKFNIHLKKKRQIHSKKHDLKYRKSDSLVVRFWVTINKSSFLHCLAWSQLRKTSPRIGKHIGKLLDATLVTLVKSAQVFFKIFGLFSAPSLLGTVK